MNANPRPGDTDAALQSVTELPETPEAPQRRSAGGRWLAAVVLLAGVALFVALQVLKPVPQTIDVPPALPLVETVELQWLDGRLQVTGNGVVLPRARVALAAQVSGEVVEASPSLHAGGRFQEGDLLLRLDARRYEAALDQAEGDLAAARAELEYSESQVRRLERLVRDSLIQQERLDEEISRRNRLQGQIAALEASIRRGRLDIEHTVITAPFDGKVFGESVDVGDIVEPGRELAQIFPDDIYEVVVSLSDDEASLIPGLWDLEAAAGKPVAHVRAEYGGRYFEWPGFVQRVEAALDENTRTVNVVVRLPDPDRPGQPVDDVGPTGDAPPLLPGMYVEAIIEGIDPGRAAAIPRAALQNDSTLWSLDEDNRLRSVPVRVIQPGPDRVVVSGPALDSVERIVVTSLAVVQEGMPVRPLESTGDGAGQ